MPPKKEDMRHSIAFILFFMLVLQSCDIDCCSGRPDPGPVFQTRILKIEVSPNPVAPGDSVQFTCVIEDSLDTRFKFIWFIDGEPKNISTAINKIKIQAPPIPGSYGGAVTADNGDEDKQSPTKSFTYEVSEN